MKKPTLCTITVLTLFLSLFALACSSYKLEGKRYQLEKAFFKADKRMMTTRFLKEAVEIYQDIVETTSDTLLKARVYLMHENPQQAIDQLQRLRREYPKSAHAADALLKIGMINDNNLNNSQSAIAAYEEFVKLYPNSFVREKVDKEIERLKK